eukprot:7007608-Prymnesium_polylepis.1
MSRRHAHTGCASVFLGEAAVPQRGHWEPYRTVAHPHVQHAHGARGTHSLIEREAEQHASGAGTCHEAQTPLDTAAVPACCARRWVSQKMQWLEVYARLLTRCPAGIEHGGRLVPHSHSDATGQQWHAEMPHDHR